MKYKKIISLQFDENTFKYILKNTFREVVTSAIKKQQSEDQNHQNELLSRKDVATMYGVSYVTLRAWEKDGIIPKPIRKGSRVYWRKSEIINDINKK